MEGLKPKIVITYQDKNVTADFTPVLKSVSFRDYLEGRAAEVDLHFSNDKGFFLGDWYPEIDDRITLKIGYEHADLIDCGAFWVDEVKLTGNSSGDEVNVRGLSLKSSIVYAPVKKQVIVRKTFKEIAGELMAATGLKAVGDLDGTWSGMQNESDIALLFRIAKETGRIFKVEGDELVFYKRENLIKMVQVRPDYLLEIPRGNVLSYDISDKAVGRIGKCTCRWWDHTTKKNISGTYDAGIKGGGSAVIWEEVKDEAEAQKKAEDYVADRNKKGEEFAMQLMGDVRLRAGVCVKPKGFGRFDKTYYIAEATHNVSSSGYTTSIILRK
ncbi:MAG: phage late control D family protein [Odoribacter splanchnicus]